MLNYHLEIPATIFGLINVYYVTRARMINWLFGILTVSLYIVIFFSAKLYADMALQCVFLGFQFYGWYQWLYGSELRSALSVKKTPRSVLWGTPILASILFSIIVFVLKSYTDSTTVYMDAFVTSLSLIAQWMLSKKWLENWLLWMIVDVVAVNMYLGKGLYLTSFLYCVFLSLCFSGYISWQKRLTG